MDLNEIAVFARVAKAGSFSAAARQLDMPNSTVSAKVAALEERLGTTLIVRTTRKLHLTQAGQTYLDRCSVALQTLNDAESELAAEREEPAGLLRITAPVELGNVFLAPILTAFVQRYPRIRIDVLLADRRVDLLAEGVDLAIRAGKLQDSTLIARKIGEAFFSAFAAPACLKEAGTPQHPNDLANHACISFTNFASGEWHLSRGDETVTVNFNGRIAVNDLNMIRAMTIAGNGVAMLPVFFCETAVQEGSLVQLLPGWRGNVSPVNFVYPAQKFVSPRVKAFLEMATEPIRNRLRS